MEGGQRRENEGMQTELKAQHDIVKELKIENEDLLTALERVAQECR